MLILDELTTSIMVAVLAGHSTTTSIAQHVGTDRFTCHRRLCKLRDEGLVDWDPGKTATVHPTVTVHTPRTIA